MQTMDLRNNHVKKGERPTGRSPFFVVLVSNLNRTSVFYKPNAAFTASTWSSFSHVNSSTSTVFVSPFAPL